MVLSAHPRSSVPKKLVAGFASGIAVVAVLAVVTLSQQPRRVSMAAGFPQTDLDMLKVMVSRPSSPARRIRLVCIHNKNVDAMHTRIYDYMIYI